MAATDSNCAHKKTRQFTRACKLKTVFMVFSYFFSNALSSRGQSWRQFYIISASGQTVRDGAVKTEVPVKIRGIEILSDTRGIDFDPYIKSITQAIKKLWLTHIPEEARPPRSIAGSTLIRFTIARM